MGNANGPSAEAMLSFSDSVILLVIPIAFGVISYILFLCRKSLTHRSLIEHQYLEFVWTLLPAVTLLFLAALSLTPVFVGRGWFSPFYYQDSRTSVVLGLRVQRFAVLDSWTIPAWGLKADAVPGRLNQLSTYLERTGIYYGQCSEICGSNHSFMPIKAEVVS